jgi:hypothetical protein
MLEYLGSLIVRTRISSVDIIPVDSYSMYIRARMRASHATLLPPHSHLQRIHTVSTRCLRDRGQQRGRLLTLIRDAWTIHQISRKRRYHSPSRLSMKGCLFLSPLPQVGYHLSITSAALNWRIVGYTLAIERKSRPFSSRC